MVITLPKIRLQWALRRQWQSLHTIITLQPFTFVMYMYARTYMSHVCMFPNVWRYAVHVCALHMFIGVCPRACMRTVCEYVLSVCLFLICMYTSVCTCACTCTSARRGIHDHRLGFVHPVFKLMGRSKNVSRLHRILTDGKWFCAVPPTLQLPIAGPTVPGVLLFVFVTNGQSTAGAR